MINKLTFERGNVQQKALIVVCVLVSVFVAVTFMLAPDANQQQRAVNALCWQTDTNCKISLSVGDISLVVDALPAVEEQIAVSIHVPAGLAIGSAFIEGQNMYMGKIPLPVKQTSERQWQGWFMLGSCSEPTMRWRITLKLKDRPEPVWIYFTTSQF